ncbi:MAG TPA: metallophosphoesterase [Methanocorpusculum sp.]|nr:metallophosphoesterase [Methanocorpusculum parvum]MBQ2772473.1 metallophosphoesterase [Methanocorpusculum sp.]HJJ63764.1 metallophosphoesterase [Methanocorpusculum sp.]HJJ66734.1 metallophosphoesterase [Methanocorpusculum sp.]HJJ71703.1 metallophosphoesterase [Methanocorpusculum sp.]
MEPEFYPTGPAVGIERREKVLAIADPHFGVEADLHRKGLHFESRSALRLERLMEIIEESDPDYLVVLGDLKHMIPYVTRQEKAEMPQILRTIRRETEFRLAPGNHDTGLEHYLEKDELLPASGAVIDGTGYFHGHMIPDESLFGHLIVCGHHHPVVNLYDDVGCALRGTPGYLLAEVDTTAWTDVQPESPTRVLLVPAFYELAGGMDVRLIPGSKVSPIAKAIRPETGEVFLKDGTYVAPFTELRPDPLELK